ncbi:FIST N-terminal domain-containing protein [Sagittula salina]|uniref:FIST C-terminal domain-containing protein n=1 Tax=Sagittula salina TaxID=2820268 RepID=A0A940MTQ2_9RHOB|nr:FIST N-terminal domain-containing protein [Sagittula salina]MBP0484696.1 FIST C-terminal domain-containing protein [Sagittula salina]
MRDDLENGLPTCVSVAFSADPDSETAAREAAAGIQLDDTCFILALLPAALDPGTVARVFSEMLDTVPVFGCTTAGQITPNGYETDALLLIAFRREHFRCASTLIAPLKPMGIAGIADTMARANSRFIHTAGWNRLALVFADGLSKQEDLLASVLESVLEGVPVFGGSAGDGLAFERTLILHNGTFHDNVALVLLIETDLYFEGLSFDHFLPEGHELVVTEANTEEREVTEINGAPAAKEYARLVGCTVADLTPQVFAENPMLVCHKQNHYVRAVSELKPPHTLGFLAAIDDGLIMVLGRGKAIIETLEAELNTRDVTGARPDFILGFDCVLRKLEIEEKNLGAQVSDIFRRRRVLGFNTYGEQHCGLHMNQTFVGVAFYTRPRGGLY